MADAADRSDVFGSTVADYHRDALVEQPVYERSDGHERPAHCALYFGEPTEWPTVDRAALRRATGAVLDLGCGPGRAGLFLRACGRDVLGLDASPRAVAVARDRGLAADAVAGTTAALPIAANAFDAAVAMGTHVGAGGRDALLTLLADLDRVLGPGARIVADCYDPTRVTDPDLRSYLAERSLGDGLATRRFRLRYDGDAGPWRTLLLASPVALRGLVAPTAWRVGAIRRGGEDTERTRYWFVLERGEDAAVGR